MTEQQASKTTVLDYGPPPPARHYSKAVVRALATIIAITLIFGLGGALVGLLLGYFVPSYYRGVFHSSDPGFSSCGVGFGLGLTEGMMLGALLGVLLVFILAWRETRGASYSK